LFSGGQTRRDGNRGPARGGGSAGAAQENQYVGSGPWLETSHSVGKTEAAPAGIQVYLQRGAIVSPLHFVIRLKAYDGEGGRRINPRAFL
jgi:hypothetical protein